MSDNLRKTGIEIDDNNGLPALGDMYKPPKKDDMGFSQPSGLPPLNPEKDDMRSQNGSPYYADGSIPPFFGESKDNGGQPNGLPPLNGQSVQPQLYNGNVPPQYNAPQGNVPPQYAQPYNAPQNVPPQYIQAFATRQFSEHDLMAEDGRKIAKVIGIIMIVCSLLSLISNVSTKVEFDNGISYALGQIIGYILPQALNIYLSVCFMKGGNKSRIFFGVIYLLAIIAVLAIIVFTVIGSAAFGAQVASFVSLGMGVLLLIMLPSLALMGFIVWGTLFSKKVKAYCGALE